MFKTKTKTKTLSFKTKTKTKTLKNESRDVSRPRLKSREPQLCLEDALAMIFIDFGLLRSSYCKISYLLAEVHWRHTDLMIRVKFDNLHMTQCAKIIDAIHGKYRQRFLSNVYKRFFYFLHVFYVF